MIDVEDLKSTEIADSLTPEDLAAIARISQIERYPAGEYIFLEDSNADRLYFVLHGKVAIGLTALPGKEVTVSTVDTGGCFAWATMLPPYTHFASGTAVVDSSVVAIDGKKLLALCEERPKLGMAIFRALTETLSRRIRDTRIQLVTCCSG